MSSCKRIYRLKNTAYRLVSTPSKNSSPLIHLNNFMENEILNIKALENKLVKVSYSLAKGFGLIAVGDISPNEIMLSIGSSIWKPYSADSAIKYGIK